MKPEMIVLSPGPCTPNESGICKDIVMYLNLEYPILGVCLGHQTIAQMYGGKIIKAKEPVHGKVCKINHIDKGVFMGLKNPLKVTRYHSLVVDKESLPDVFEITAMTKDGEIMGLRHKELPIEGVQFHPEAILTEQGIELLNNFLNISKEWWKK
ncbi:MAG: aminodeoxychorismate/anthranilate synthase component II, partial [Clostridiales bacterium]|nr:aminodeoxychorismate/anthranilate synthase component II [Clostridiales bacterium]